MNRRAPHHMIGKQPQQPIALGGVLRLAGSGVRQTQSRQRGLRAAGVQVLAWSEEMSETERFVVWDVNGFDAYLVVLTD